jgi:hypothetical protein
MVDIRAAKPRCNGSCSAYNKYPYFKGSEDQSSDIIALRIASLRTRIIRIFNSG